MAGSSHTEEYEILRKELRDLRLEIGAICKACSGLKFTPKEANAEKERHEIGDNAKHFGLGISNIGHQLSGLKSRLLWRDAVCEMIIVFLMMFGSLLVTVRFNGRPLNIVAVALTAGLYVFVLIEGFAHVQSSCMNPMALATFVITKRLGIVKAIVYLGFQMIGSSLAGLLVLAVTPEEHRMYVRPLAVGKDVTSAGALAVEFVVSACLVFVLLGATDHEKRGGKVFVPGLPIGITITVGIMAADQYTGGCMNPIIAFGPAAATGIWEYQWIYWLGDMGGTFFANFLYAAFKYDGPFVWRCRERSQAKNIDDKYSCTVVHVIENKLAEQEEKIEAPPAATCSGHSGIRN